MSKESFFDSIPNGTNLRSVGDKYEYIFGRINSTCADLPKGDQSDPLAFESAKNSLSVICGGDKKLVNSRVTLDKEATNTVFVFLFWLASIDVSLRRDAINWYFDTSYHRGIPCYPEVQKQGLAITGPISCAQILVDPEGFLSRIKKREKQAQEADKKELAVA